MSAVIFWSEHVFAVHALHENLIQIGTYREEKKGEEGKISSKDKFKSGNFS